LALEPVAPAEAHTVIAGSADKQKA
jgi:hypothetical protein